MPEIINFYGAELQVRSILDVQLNSYLLLITILFILIGLVLREID